MWKTKWVLPFCLSFLSIGLIGQSLIQDAKILSEILENENTTNHSGNFSNAPPHLEIIEIEKDLHYFFSPVDSNQQKIEVNYDSVHVLYLIFLIGEPYSLIIKKYKTYQV